MSKLIFAVEGVKMILPMSEQLEKMHKAAHRQNGAEAIARPKNFFALHRIGPSANHKG